MNFKKEETQKARILTWKFTQKLNNQTVCWLRLAYWMVCRLSQIVNWKITISVIMFCSKNVYPALVVELSISLQWRHNGRDDVSNHQPHHADERKHQSSASLAFVRRIHRWPVNSPHIWPVTRKMFPFDDVIISHALPPDRVTGVIDETVGRLSYLYIGFLLNDPPWLMFGPLLWHPIIRWSHCNPLEDQVSLDKIYWWMKLVAVSPLNDGVTL